MEQTRTNLPGFGLPVNHHVDSAFPSSLHTDDLNHDRTVLPLTTLREFTMLNIMNYVTDKPDWRTKVFQDDIIKKWKQEALEMPGKDISVPMIDWVIKELQYKAKLFQDIGAVAIYTGHVVKSDSIVPESLKLELQATVAKLEDVPDDQKDWHPGSNGKVLDLVHPSLYPLVYGRTRVLETGKTSLEDCIARCGEGQTTQIPSQDDVAQAKILNAHLNAYSRKYQWLPCEVDISGEHSKITSYINNLHPLKHKNLYQIIERVIDAAIPLWNMTLGPLDFCDWSNYTRIEYKGSYNKTQKQPEPEIFVTPIEPDPTINLKEEYAKSGLQIIVKLANIHLTPENPTYEGGYWHVEGQLNEHICATAIYYYSNENIQNNTLAFRQQCSTEADFEYRQNYHSWLSTIFGCKQEGPGIQFVGSISTLEGRLLTFPNILQHQVQPFSLLDQTKPGHRKILALFLVDPHLKVLSTENVPCQQMDWWREHIAGLGTKLEKLPLELRDAVFDGVKDDFPIGSEEAKAMRLELMDERKAFVVRHDVAFKGLEFSLCEH